MSSLIPIGRKIAGEDERGNIYKDLFHDYYLVFQLYSVYQYLKMTQKLGKNMIAWNNGLFTAI